jgi:branched-chain amino acid transport system permease protein
VPWGNKAFRLGGADINWSYIAAMATAAMAFVAVYFFYRSRMGIAMRAVAQDQEAAMAQGINIGRVFAIAWAAGAVLAAIGGIFAVQPPVKQTGSVDQETVFVAFRALPAVILGGLDSVQGALVGGLLVGLAEIYAGQYLSGQTDILGAGYPVIVPYIVMIVGLLVRPYGLFGTPEIRRV